MAVGLARYPNLQADDLATVAAASNDRSAAPYPWLSIMMARLNLIIVNVSLALLAVAVFQRLLGFPPLILFIVPVAIVFPVSGFGAALAATMTGAVVGDYFFVAPLGHVTVHAEGLRLLFMLLLGTVVVHLVTPPGSLRKPGRAKVIPVHSPTSGRSAAAPSLTTFRCGLSGGASALICCR